MTQQIISIGNNSPRPMPAPGQIWRYCRQLDDGGRPHSAYGLRFKVLRLTTDFRPGQRGEKITPTGFSPLIYKSNIQWDDLVVTYADLVIRDGPVYARTLANFLGDYQEPGKPSGWLFELVVDKNGKNVAPHI